jgi:serine/threonine protein kinase
VRDDQTLPAEADALAATLTSGRPGSDPTSREHIGRYRIERELGRGGMGIVYLAFDPDLDRKVAVKVLRGRDDRRLVREGQAIAKLRHPNVVSVFDIGTDAGDVFIAMEYVPGGTIGEWLKIERPWRVVIDRYLAAGRGLAAAHAAGLVHRDFKPDNVLLGDDGAVVVSDFGLARIDEDADTKLRESALDVTRTAGVAGTPAYMSPEQFRGEAADARSDQFSFCVALWEGLFGARPFGGGSVEDLSRAVLAGVILSPPSREVPRRVVRALRRGLSRDAAARFASMSELLAAIAPRGRAPIMFGCAGVLALSVAGYLVLHPSSQIAAARLAAIPTTPSCADAGAPIRSVWNDDARAKYIASDPDADNAAQDVTWFDQYAGEWADAAIAACRRRQSDPVRARAQF